MYEFHKLRIRGTRRFYSVGALLFRDNVHTHLVGTHLGVGGGGGGRWLGASVREGASNRDITVIPLSIDVVSTDSK